MTGYLKAFDELMNVAGVNAALEVGCGEGNLAIRLAARGVVVTATEPDGDTIEGARRLAARRGVAIRFEKTSIEAMDVAAMRSPLVVCCEVLEHVSSPEAALSRLAALAAPWLLASVPREPLWRALNMARGAYWSSRGNTPGHVNHWSKNGFIDFIGGGFEVVEVRSPLPWTMVLARERKGAG